MLNFLDDYPIHQTPEPVAHPATADRNVYDRFFFDGFSDDGEWFFGIAMGLYPHRDILDCASRWSARTACNVPSSPRAVRRTNAPT